MIVKHCGYGVVNPHLLVGSVHEAINGILRKMGIILTGVEP